jgi:hypothetical protein
VSGRSSHDVFAVGADRGSGPLVLHFDGQAWAELHTGSRGDLWWVQTFADGRALMSGAGAAILRYDGHSFARLATPGKPTQTIYGVSGTSADDFYAVGSAAGHDGFVWHYRAGAFESENLPPDLPHAATGDVPGFYKVYDSGGEVWVVGSAGAVMHRKGAEPFRVVPTTTKDTIFTVHGTGDRVVAVGGGGNGLVLDGAGGAMRDASPPHAGLLQGVFATEHGDWASGERSAVYTRPSPNGAFASVDHGLELPSASSLHSIFVDDVGGVWSAGGNVLTAALDGGMLIHFGAKVPEVVIDDEAQAPR